MDRSAGLRSRVSQPVQTCGSFLALAGVVHVLDASLFSVHQCVWKAEVCFSFSLPPGERMDSHRQVVDRLRSAFHSGVTLPEKFRRTQLTNLMAMIKENEEQILNALHKDLAKVQGFVSLSFTHSDA